MLEETITDVIAAGPASKGIAKGNIEVVISLDAAKNETYKIIRSKDELEKVETNVKRLVELKKEYNTKLPVVRLSFVVQKENTTHRQ